MVMGEIQSLPEACILRIISFTSPLDACRLAAVSPIWQRAAVSDLVWERFLPRDYPNILSRAIYPVDYSSPKELFFRLCKGILIDGGFVMFALKQSNGKQSYQIHPRRLSLNHANNREVWRRFTNQAWREQALNSRFPEFTFLRQTSALFAGGQLIRGMLAAKTYYAVYLIYRLSTDTFGFHSYVTAVVSQDDRPCYKKLCLDSCFTRGWKRGQLRPSLINRLHPSYEDPVLRPEVADWRRDRWLTLEMGRFYCDGGEDGEDREVNVDCWLVDLMRESRGGMLLEGFELRPLN